MIGPRGFSPACTLAGDGFAWSLQITKRPSEESQEANGNAGAAPAPVIRSPTPVNCLVATSRIPACVLTAIRPLVSRTLILPSSLCPSGVEVSTPVDTMNTCVASSWVET